MNEHYDNSTKSECEPAISIAYWEARWFASGSAIDPSHDRATAALKRWVDGMEAALSKRP